MSDATIEPTTRPAQPVAPPADWTYAPAPESTDIVRIEDRYGLFIGGEFVEPTNRKYFPTIDPATEDTLAEVAEAGPEDVDIAVAGVALVVVGAYLTSRRETAPV